MGDLHILVIPSSYPMPHAPLRGVFFREQAHALRKAGIRVGVVYPDFRSLRTLSLSGMLNTRCQETVHNDEGIDTVRFHGWNVLSSRLRGMLFTRKARQLAETYIDNFGWPDLLHAHGIVWGGVGARSVGRALNIPYVVTAHSSNFLRRSVKACEKSPAQEAIEDARALFAVSSALAKEIASFARHEQEAVVVPNMVNTGFFTLPPQSRTTSPFKFLMIAALSPNKGVHNAIRAFAKASGQVDKATELCIGGGEKRGYAGYRRRLEKLVVSLGVENQVQFLGPLSRNQVRDAMWQSNTFVLSSYVETFGVVLIEAMSTGLPVVATRSGGPEEIVGSDVGWLADPGDVDGLAEALVKAYDHWDEMKIRAPDIRKQVVAKFSEQAVARWLRSCGNDIVATIRSRGCDWCPCP